MRPLHLILALYVLLAVVTSVRVPLGESPDELDHFLYVEHLVQENVLPVMSPVFDENVTMEANQPPLYYLMGALLTNWIDWETSSELPVNACFDREQDFRPTLYLHSSAENWRGGWLAFRLVRLLSIALGACTIWLAYRTAHLLDSAIAPLAATLLAFNPQFIFITASVNNDVLTTLLGAAIVYIAVRKTAQTVHRSLSTVYWQLGFLFGLAAFTKLGLLAFGLIVVWLLWGDFGRKTPRHLLQLTLPPLLIAGWWYIRNIQLYGDPLVWTVHLQAKGEYVSRTTPLQLADLRDFVIIHFQSYFAWFGWLNIQPSNWVYLVFAVIVIAALIGCIIGWRTLFTRRWIPVLIAILGTYIALLRYIQTINWSGYQGRLAFAAAAPIAILLAFGINHFIQTVFPNPHPPAPSLRGRGGAERNGKLVSPLPEVTVTHISVEDEAKKPSSVPTGHLLPQGEGTLSGLVDSPLPEGEGSGVRVLPLFIPIALGTFVLIGTLWFAYRDVTAVYADATESCTVIREQWELERYEVSEVQAGQTSVAIRTAGYGQSAETVLPITLQDVTGATIGAGEIALVPSERNIFGSSTLTLNPDVPPSRATILIDDVPIGALRIAQPLQADANPQVETEAVFGEQIRLLGYDLVERELVLYWEAVGEISADYTRFVHLLDANDEIIFQDDIAPTYPTGIWDAGEIVTSQLTLPDTPFTTIAVGWYQPQPFENLLLPDGSGRYILP